MSAEARLKLQITEFTKNYTAATAHAKKESDKQKKEAGGVGQSLSDGLKNAAAGFTLGAVIAEIRGTVEEAQRLANLSASLNEPVEALNKVKFASRALGLDFETVTELGRELEDRLGDLGNAEPVEVMNRFGLSVQELIAMPLDEKLLTISEAFEKSRGDGVAYSDLLKVLGDSVGEQLLPMLAQGKDALEDLFSSAPSLSAEMVNGMAAMNEEIGKATANIENWKTRYIGSILGVARIMKDALSTGSWEEATQMDLDRQMESLKKGAASADMNARKSEAIAAARDAEAAVETDKKAAASKKKNLEDLAKLKDSMEKGELDLLPDDQKIDALRAKLEKALGDFMGNFTLNYDVSEAGLEKLAKDREGNANLPEEGANSALEAYEKLEEVRKLQNEIAKTDERLAAEKKATAQKDLTQQDELAKLREASDKAATALLSPEEQARKLRDQLGDSFGVKITGAADIEAGLRKLRGEATAARDKGDVEGEKAALERLNEAQRQVSEFRGMANGSTGPQKQGEFQTLVDEIFNRDPAAEQLRVLQDGLRKQDDLIGRMDAVIKKMDEPPPRDTFSFQTDN